MSPPPSPSLDGPLAPERRPGFWFDARVAAFLLKVEQPPRVRTQAPLLLSASQTFLPPRWHGRRGDAGPELPQGKKNPGDLPKKRPLGNGGRLAINHKVAEVISSIKARSKHQRRSGSARPRRERAENTYLPTQRATGTFQFGVFTRRLRRRGICLPVI